MDNIKKLKDIILELNEVTEAEHIKSIESSVTTSWGEEIWDHEKISRDILQNARDGVVSAKMDIDQIDYNHLEVIIEMENNWSDYIIIEYCDTDIEELKN